MLEFLNPSPVILQEISQEEQLPQIEILLLALLREDDRIKRHFENT